MLLTLDAEGQLLSVPVRLGQAVDVVAQAGRPKTISGGYVCWERPVDSSLWSDMQLGVAS
jgi:hypothetical protein